MTRIAAIYDIHGNLPALEAVLREIRAEGVDRVIVGGDVIPGPMPRETMDCLLELNIPVDFIRGNGDREVLAQMNGVITDWFRSAQPGRRDPVSWSAGQLTERHRMQLAGWPTTLAMDLPPVGRVLFCHATPRDDNEIFTRLTPEDSLLFLFEGLDADLIVCGHTHMQFDRMVGSKRIVNAGSAGMPFAEPGAYWLMLDGKPKLRNTDYDLHEASRRIVASGFPDAVGFATNNVCSPPSGSVMLDVLEKVAVKLKR